MASTGGRRLDESFFERPILNSPYAYPPRHWDLDEDGQPTNRIIETRRRSELITPVPKPQKGRRSPAPAGLALGPGAAPPPAHHPPHPPPLPNHHPPPLPPP